MDNLLPNKSLWDQFGIKVDPGQGNEYFIFDTERGLNLNQNICHVSWTDNSFLVQGMVGGKDYIRSGKLPNGTKEAAAAELDEFLYRYFFG